MELETLNKIVTSIHKDIAHIVNRFNRDRMDGSDGWVAFTKEFDESTKRLETTLDSGEGTTVVLLFDDIWLNSDGDVTYKFVIDHIDANNAQSFLLNDFIVCIAQHELHRFMLSNLVFETIPDFIDQG